MSVLIHEQGGQRTIYYPDDRHLRQLYQLRPDSNQHPDLVGPCKRAAEARQDVAGVSTALRIVQQGQEELD